MVSCPFFQFSNLVVEPLRFLLVLFPQPSRVKLYLLKLRFALAPAPIDLGRCLLLTWCFKLDIGLTNEGCWLCKFCSRLSQY